jgi:flagellar basal body-associated protein FliL
MSNQFRKKMKGLIWFAVAIGIFIFIALILAAIQFFKFGKTSN